MVYIVVFSFFLLWAVSITGYGSILIWLFRDYKFSKNIRIAVFGILGLAILTVMGNIFNFFIPLNLIFSTVVTAIGVILFGINFKKIIDGFSKYELIFLIVLIAYLTFVPFNWANFNDTGIYHLQSMKWLHESRTPLGLANLHGRLGFNSSWFTVAAIVDWPVLLKESPLFIINAMVMFFTGSAIFLTFKKTILDKISFSDYFLIFMLIAWFGKTPFNMASPAPDLPVMLLILFIVYLVICAVEKIEHFRVIIFIAIIYSVFALTIKLSALPFVLGLFILLLCMEIYKRKKHLDIVSDTKVYWYKLIVSSSIIVVPWIVRNIFLSGCIVYPVSFTRFGNLKWVAKLSQVKSEMAWIRSWARKPSTPSKEVLSDWNWFQPWFRGFLRSERLFFGILFAGIILIFLCLIFNRKKILLDNKKFVIPLIITILAVVYWFITAPDLRFGYGFLFSLVLLMFSFGFYHINVAFINWNIKKIFLLLILIFFLFRTVPLIINTNSINRSFSTNWLPMVSIEVEERKTKEGSTIYVPAEGDQSWYGPLPITPNFNPEIKILYDDNGKPIMFWYPEK